METLPFVFVTQHINQDCLKAARQCCNSIMTEENIWEKKSVTTYHRCQNCNITKRQVGVDITIQPICNRLQPSS